MKRLCVLAEGWTEVDFVTRILRPHLESRISGAIDVSAPNLRGYTTFAATKKFVKNLLDSPAPHLQVTTMIDMFRLAGDFPGKAHPAAADPLERVRRLEELFATEIGDARFFPYLQLHEFEALVLVNLPLLADQHPNRERAISDLALRLQGEFSAPEYVNDKRPPSYRIKRVVPEYHKRLDGINVIERIGLSRLRDRCTHFRQWLGWMESLVR